MKKIDTDFLIIGAGWSGLVAAEILSSKNQKVLVLEKEAEVGGLARTFNFKGFKFDIGGHGLFFKNQRNISYLKNLIEQNELLVLKRNSKLLFKNKYIDYPVNIRSLFTFNKKDMLKIMFNLLSLNKNKRRDNFEEWIKSNYGQHLYKIYFRDYTNKVWGIPCDQLSAAWADTRIGGSNLLKYLKKFFMNDYSVKESARSFYYPRKGIGLLVETLEQKLKESSIYKNVQLQQFHNENGRLSSLSFMHNGSPAEVSFKHVISSIPVRELVKTLPLHKNHEFMGIEAGIKYRSLIIVSIEINRKNVSNWHWCYIPSKDVIFSRIHEPKFWSLDMAEKEKTLLCVEIFCDKNDAVWNKEESEIAKVAIEGLRRLELIKKEDKIIDYCIKKIDYAYPLYYNGAEKSLSTIKSLINSFSNLRLIGRSGTHSYFDMEECLDNVRQEINLISG
ncbi:MAG: FAD-dependent oxidoreductase [Candidatus Omnitrophica bacterium]|nr:FAD-dependent oxidoreductase [Candidatus Omnitrophota bacterium]